MEISTIGLDLAKSIFQVHAINASGGTAVRKALRRSQVLPFFTKLPPCRVGIEACGTSHHWARELTRLGHVHWDGASAMRHLRTLKAANTIPEVERSICSR